MGAAAAELIRASTRTPACTSKLPLAGFLAPAFLIYRFPYFSATCPEDCTSVLLGLVSYHFLFRVSAQSSRPTASSKLICSTIFIKKMLRADVFVSSFEFGSLFFDI